MSEATSAIFISYAREDSVAADRIAEALRSHGIEVWFDQNELRGGDTWDQKIRGQIRTCSLLIPIVSANTQGRGEGYFRREWKLAAERTHDMAAGIPFLVPVVIDDTAESAAMVPDEFMKVQWTRLPAGRTTPQFAAQVKRLLEAPRSAPPTRRAPATAAATPLPESPRATRLPNWAIALVVLALGAIAFVALRRVSPDPSETLKVAKEAKPVLSSPASNLPPPSSPAAEAPAKSIAVLPFANLSTEKENEFFADGVQDDVITNLAKIRDLTVISRTSTLAYRDTAARNLKKIGAELNVAAVLEASVRRVGSKVHLNAQLIDARTDAHLWADTFDGDASDIFALQADLAKKIATALKATLTPGEKTLIDRRPTENQEAYELYLRARAMSQEIGENGTLADYDRIIYLYEAAVAKDPSFALAHAQAALTHSIAYWFGSRDPTPARAARCKAEVDASMRLAPDAPETHLALGAYRYRVELDWIRALAEFRVAEPGLPNNAQLNFWLAVTHRRLGKWLEALAYFERAAALNPRDSGTITNHVQFLNDLRRWNQARETNAKYLGYFPADLSLLIEKARSSFAVDGDRNAWARATDALPRDPTEPTGLANKFYAALQRGDLDAADRALAELPVPSIAEPFSSIINDPIAFHRASLAFVRGDLRAAERYAKDAMAYYRAAKSNARQIPLVRLRLAQAEAWAGQSDEAILDAQTAFAAMTAQDIYNATTARRFLGTVYVATGRREEALACLREMFIGPSAQSPNEIRIDPFWARLRDDPRFEEILKSAKPL